MVPLTPAATGIRNTHGPRERQFAIRCVIVTAVFVALFLAVLFLTPTRCRWVIWTSYLIAAPFVIPKWNHKQLAIRAAEAEPANT